MSFTSPVKKSADIDKQDEISLSRDFWNTVGYHNTINKKNCWIISPFCHKRHCDQSLPVSFSTWWCVPVSSISDVLQIRCYHGHHNESVLPVIFCAGVISYRLRGNLIFFPTVYQTLYTLRILLGSFLQFRYCRYICWSQGMENVSCSGRAWTSYLLHEVILFAWCNLCFKIIIWCHTFWRRDLN